MWRNLWVLAWMVAGQTVAAQEPAFGPLPPEQNPTYPMYMPAAPGSYGAAGTPVQPLSPGPGAAPMPPGPNVVPMSPAMAVPPTAAVPTLSGPVEFPRPAPGPAREIPWSPSPAPALAQAVAASQSMWYTRVDYFRWNEQIDGQDFVNESGALVTLGYQHRFGRERVRVEVFGNSMNYEGSAQYDDGTSEPLKSVTNYLGVRAEYDLLLQPACWERQRLLLGVGTRLWLRDLPDAYTDSGGFVDGYQETWWTIYPYFGGEAEWPVGRGELFVSGRLGCTAVTLEHVSGYDAVLYPKAGILGTFEGGMRWTHLSLSAYLEAMTWSQSAEVRGILQPESHLYLAGMKIGWMF